LLETLSGYHIKIVRAGLDGAADNPFDQWQSQNGNQGFAVTLLP
jgi:hypothetical protein